MQSSKRDFHYPEIGMVHLTMRRDSRSITMRWRKDRLHMNIPPTATQKDIVNALEKYKTRLLDRKPTLRYHDGQTLQFYSLTINLGRQHLHPDRIIAQYSNGKGSILIGDDLDFDEDTTTRGISDFICKITHKAAHIDLIPRGREVAEKLGVFPTDWEIGSGHRKLGHCTTSRVISLSYVVMFLPPHLRDYIICHELAHLSEMNHSQNFHALCNTYCKGREKELIAELRRFRWPVLM